MRYNSAFSTERPIPEEPTREDVRASWVELIDLMRLSLSQIERIADKKDIEEVEQRLSRGKYYGPEASSLKVTLLGSE
jgi:hypothetical protein